MNVSDLGKTSIFEQMNAEMLPSFGNIFRRFFFFNMNFADVYHLELSIFMPIEMFCFELVFMGN